MCQTQDKVNFKLQHFDKSSTSVKKCSPDKAAIWIFQGLQPKILPCVLILCFSFMMYVTDRLDRTCACLKVCPQFDVDKDQVRCTSLQGLTFINSCTTSKELSIRVKHIWDQSQVTEILEKLVTCIFTQEKGTAFLWSINSINLSFLLCL